SALASASMADLAGDGTTGDLTGTTMMFGSTIMPLYLAAEFSVIANTSTLQEVELIAAVDLMAMGFVEKDPTAARLSIHSLPRMPRLAAVPALSVVSIMEALPEVSPLAVSPASAAALTGVEDCTVEGVVVGAATDEHAFGS